MNTPIASGELAEKAIQSETYHGGIHQYRVNGTTLELKRELRN